eukprot:s3122_g2.t1
MSMIFGSKLQPQLRCGSEPQKVRPPQRVPTEFHMTKADVEVGVQKTNGHRLIWRFQQNAWACSANVFNSD